MLIGWWFRSAQLYVFGCLVFDACALLLGILACQSAEHWVKDCGSIEGGRSSILLCSRYITSLLGPVLFRACVERDWMA